MKKIENVTWQIVLLLVCVVFWMFPESLPAQVNSLSVGDVTGKQGEVLSLPVSLDNESEVVGGQFRLMLPTGMSVDGVEMDVSRSNGHVIEYHWSENTHELSVLFYASPTAMLNGNNGRLCNILLSIPDDYVPGDYSVTFAPDVKLASDAMTLILGVESKAGSVHVESKPEIYYTIDVTATTGGYVKGGGTYEEGHEVMLTAIAEDGYEFIRWSDGEVDNPYHFIVTEDKVINAEFSPKSYMLTYMLDGEVYHTEEVLYGSTIIPLEAPEKEGYVFSGWDSIPQTMPSHSVVVNGSMVLTSVISIQTVLPVDVYSLEGILLKHNVPFSDWYKDLRPGVYLVDGKKLLTPFYKDIQ